MLDPRHVNQGATAKIMIPKKFLISILLCPAAFSFEVPGVISREKLGLHGVARRKLRGRLLQEFDTFYETYKKMFKLSFSPEEDAKRKTIFSQNLKKIQEHNNSDGLFKMGLNEFTAMTDDEFRSSYLENPQPILDPASVETQAPPHEVFPKTEGRRLQTGTGSLTDIIAGLAPKINWATKGKVTPVKHQRTCQACYVFSAIGALESAIALRFNVTLQLSEQEIVDCSYTFRNNGCIGGQPSFAYDYALLNGLNLQQNYPYEATEGSCKAPTFKLAFKQPFRYFKPELNIISVLQYLQFGPVAVNHYVPDSFKYYFSGIFQTADCAFQTIINHSATLIGYDLTAPQPFFILKNSWGLKWGEQGFYKVLIGELNFDNPGFCFLASNGYNVFPTYF